MIIEQSKEQIDDSVSFHRHSEIGFLRLARARIWSRERITRIAPRDVIFSMNEIFESQDESKPLIVIECCFEAEYQLVSDFTPSEKQIEAFRAANAVFNCWPFFREFVQTSVTRMHFPPPPVPFLRLSRKTEVARKATQKQAIQKQIPQPPD